MSKRRHEVVTRERLMEVLDYNKETGIFTWKKKLSARGLLAVTPRFSATSLAE